MKTQTLVLIVVCLLANCPVVEADGDIPRITMPDQVHEILRGALETYPFSKHRSEDWLNQNREALDHLREIPWPDLGKIERVHLYDIKQKDRFTNAWRVPGEDDELILLMPDFTERRVAKAGYDKIEVFEYGDELTELLRYLSERDPETKRSWDFSFICDSGSGGLPYYGGVFLLNHAYAAAYFGKTTMAKTLVHEALKQRGLCFKHAYNEGAWHSFYRGIQLLEGGSDRTEVLRQWERTLHVYGHSRYQDQLLDLVGELRGQVKDDEELKAAAVELPEALPVTERVDYYVARFPDVHGVQFSQPGHCSTLGMGEGTRISDAVVSIGRPAVPRLIDHLTDRRLTRSIGFHRNFSPHRTVLRVQDVAVQCISKIVDIRFYNSSSTSSYLSNEEQGIRDPVIADIKSWWNQHGHESPLKGYIARLEQGSLWERLQTLAKIEAIDADALDSIAVLKSWAIDVDFRSLPEIAVALAKRGDMSLLPAMRKMMRASKRAIPNECVWYVLRYGDAEDYRFLRQAAREDIDRGGTLGTSRIYGSVKAGVERSKNPLSVPILVDFLDQRRVSGSRWISKEEGAMGFSCADSCMGALIRLTEHNEGYEPGDPKEERYRAIDRWTRWWKQEGKAAYLKKYPAVLQVLAEGVESDTIFDSASLPPLVLVADVEKRTPITYHIPRDELMKLVRAGEIEARRIDGDLAFRFASREAAMRWFARATPLCAEAKNRIGKGHVSLGKIGLYGPVCGPDGRSWFWNSGGDQSPLALRDKVRGAWADETPIISGAKLLGFDARGRLWLTKANWMTSAYGCSPESWEERKPVTPEAAGLPTDAHKAVVGFRETCSYVDRAKRFYLADTLGVHVLGKDGWSYQSFFARNYREERWHGDIKAFNAIRFAEDLQGNVFAWARWGNNGWSGTIGYWMFNGNTWTNVDTYERIQQVIPRAPGDVIVVSAAGRPHVLRQGKAVTADETQRELFPDLKFGSARVVAIGNDGDAYLLLDDVTVLDPFEKVKYRAAIIPTQGQPKDLGSEAGLFFDRICSRGAVVGPDGWIYGTDGSVVETMSPDGLRFGVLEGTRRFANMTVKAVDAAGQIYLLGGGEVWRIARKAAFSASSTDTPLLPSMRIRVSKCASPDSLGRMWCTWAVAGSPTAMFDGTTWKTFPEASVGRETGEPRGFIAAFPGSEGSMLFEDDRYRFHLFDTNGWVMEKSAAALAVRYPERVTQAVSYPPSPADNFYHHLVKDAKGRIWWASWFHKWGVVDGKKQIDGNSSGIAVGPGRERVLSVVAPIGDGTKLLVGDEDGAAAIVQLVDGRIAKLADSPVRVDDRPPAGWRSNVLRDRMGRVWIMTQNRSQAIGPKGDRVASHAGWLTLEDSEGGLWFNERRHPTAFIVRLAADGREARLEVPNLLERASMAEAPDASVWALTGSQLIRIAFSGEKLEIVESYTLPISYLDHLWCDRSGRVWHWHYKDSEPGVRTLICYPTSKAISGHSPR
jgi:hypothetical protein